MYRRWIYTAASQGDAIIGNGCNESCRTQRSAKNRSADTPEQSVKKTAKTIEPVPQVDARELTDSNQQPIWHVSVLGALTMGVPYMFWWGYKTWRDLKNYAETLPEGDESNPVAKFRNASPLLRMIGLSVPFLQIYLLAVLVLNAADLHPDANSFPRRHQIAACAIVIAAFLGILCLWRLPQAYFMLGYLCTVPFAVVQLWINKYWQSVEPAGMPIRYAFSIGEMVSIIAGAGWIGLVAAGMMIGVKPL